MKLKLAGLLLIVVVLFSCSNKEVPIGKWEDNIELSKKQVKFTAAEETITITTKGEGWWISDITLNNDLITGINEIDTTVSNFIIDKVEFKLERKNAKEIQISMTENQTNTKRILFIGLQSGNYFDGIFITQSAK
ncbi:hypothetical protein [Maribacter sp.]|uniref:hypothetical protein n=1 Tax=Maribacter sp. TaxID=1897614 RepID=UPI0025C09DD2|nr:hypothetical protein [Maribacter sp.]